MKVEASRAGQMRFAAGAALLIAYLWNPAGTAAGGAEKPVTPLWLPDTHGARQRVPAAKAPATLCLFIGHDCPVSNAYAPEIGRIAHDYGKKGVAFRLVYVDPDLTPAAAEKHAREYNLPAPRLLDSDQRLVAREGATVTPEAAVLTPSGQLLYRGRIDNRYAAPGKPRPGPTTHDLRDALDAVLAGRRVPAPRTPAVGCLIPLKR